MLETFRAALPNIAAVVGLALIPLFVISNSPSRSPGEQVSIDSSKELVSVETLSKPDVESVESVIAPVVESLELQPDAPASMTVAEPVDP